jgi:hypothetical protein
VAEAELTPKMEHFARLIAGGQTASDAYRTAYDVAPSTSLDTIHRASSELRHTPKVAARVQSYKQQIAAAFVITEAELRKDLHDLVDVDPGELSGVWVGCCRYCHGTGGAPQWVDGEELADATEQAIAKNSVAPGTCVLPKFGGFGYDKRRPPAEDCRECNGFGISYPYVRDTRRLSATARKLYKGHKINKRDGTVELLTHDQTTLRDQLNKSVGLYKSVSLNLNADVPAGLEGMPLNDMLDLLRTLHPVVATHAPIVDASVVATVDAQPAVDSPLTPAIDAPLTAQPPVDAPKPWDTQHRKPNRLPLIITKDGSQ